MTEWVDKFTDHSYWNDIRDWLALRNLGVSVVLLRASSGGTYRDPKFIPYYTGAKAAGLKVLAYHVSNPLLTSDTNIINFKTAVNGIKLDGYPVLDCQLTGGQSSATIQARNKDMFYKLKSSFGGAINYTAKWFWDQFMGKENAWAKEFPLIVANYYDALSGTAWPSKTAYASTIPTDYINEEPFAWQFSDKGLFPEVSPGNMDKNVGYPRFHKSILWDAPTPPSSTPAFKMKTLQNMNVRSAPYGSIIGSVPAGATITPIGVGGSDSWVEISPGKWVAVNTGGKLYCIKI